ncbi:aspartate/glutamate racemase family protein [Parafrigoribacterium mesophilum]|uniref:aspartate/glutamate racemase family protein n=1 Tax=Parafrigoribacterium mesophilum TaxID=433646 RepID=UPI0031FC9474
MAFTTAELRDGPVIALVSAVTSAIAPAARGLEREFPEACAWNLVDDRLITEAIAAGGLTDDLRDRMTRLIRYALDGGAAAVLLTCSMYGPVAHEVAASVPVPILAADDAAFEAAAASGHERIALVSSLPVPLADARERFAAFLRSRAGAPELTGAPDFTGVPVFTGVLAAGAYAASAAPDATGEARSPEALAQALAAAVRGSDADAVLLAQYSLAPAAQRLAALAGVPVFSGPDAAARLLRSRLLPAG